ncbi:mitochondrial thiamine pyrophosphate transporter [Cymbomonas tetramitiformis]|uniref:Mitochondrial thiamine pyrophosphate transporter n=1 Tax=Cymbomonas tetramitiformis TaxID=36881 RepID=A0AAE0GHJ0_9CHLO|nr:mitochondrial thiamine pyrophosphate transporter [Cymbomonas tetramitiformis]
MQSPGASPVGTGEILEPTETRTEISQDDVSRGAQNTPPPLIITRSGSDCVNDNEKTLSSPTVRRTSPANEISETVFFCLSKDNFIRSKCIRVAKSSYFEGVVITIIAANCLALCLYVPSDPPDSSRNKLLDLLDFIFTICFTIELVLKLLCYGLRDYLKDSWHWLDVVVVAAGYMSVLIGSASENLSPIKIFRILRPLRTITMFPGLRLLVNTVISCVPMVFNVVLLCIYFLLVMGILGNQLFSGQLRNRILNILRGDGATGRRVEDEDAGHEREELGGGPLGPLALARPRHLGGVDGEGASGNASASGQASSCQHLSVDDTLTP